MTLKLSASQTISPVLHRREYTDSSILGPLEPGEPAQTIAREARAASRLQAICPLCGCLMVQSAVVISAKGLGNGALRLLTVLPPLS
jgi:hypothetical protein